MPKIGLKIWSTNVDNYLPEAERLFSRDVFDYVELFVVPGSVDALSHWKVLHERRSIPFVIHVAHSAAGFNLACAEAEAQNLLYYSEAKRFADELEAWHVIFHGGMDGTVDEAVRQLKALREPRAIVENKPFVPLPNPVGAKRCRGATVEELAKIIGETGCGFCLDVGHAVCSACSQQLEPYAFVEELMRRFSPVMFHLSDVLDLRSPYDSHPHLGTGVLDIERLCRSVFSSASLVSIETVKSSPTNLDDFERDVERLRRFLI